MYLQCTPNAYLLGTHREICANEVETRKKQNNSLDTTLYIRVMPNAYLYVFIHVRLASFVVFIRCLTKDISLLTCGSTHCHAAGAPFSLKRKSEQNQKVNYLIYVLLYIIVGVPQLSVAYCDRPTSKWVTPPTRQSYLDFIRRSTTSNEYIRSSLTEKYACLSFAGSSVPR